MFPLRETPLFFLPLNGVVASGCGESSGAVPVDGRKRCCFETVSFREDCRKNGMEGADACGDLLRFK